MSKTVYAHFVGIDCSDATIAVALNDEARLVAERTFENATDGFEQLHQWLSTFDSDTGSTLVCVENTGVYSEHVCYWLASRQYDVWLEAPEKTSRAAIKRDKTDTIDARQIAAYAYRYRDQAEPWEPNHEIVEQVRMLLSAREQLQEQRTANKNQLKMLDRKVVQTPTANTVLSRVVAQLEENIKELEHEMKRLIKNDPRFGSTVMLLVSIPSVQWLMASNLLVVTNGFTRRLEPRQLAAFLGICPHEHQSGTSVYHRPRSAGFGPPRMRKLLYLAAMSLRTHNHAFKAYYLRKLAEGKPKKLVIDNIANKLLRIICGVLRSGISFSENYRSINPQLVEVCA